MTGINIEKKAELYSIVMAKLKLKVVELNKRDLNLTKMNKDLIAENYDLKNRQDRLLQFENVED